MALVQAFPAGGGSVENVYFTSMVLDPVIGTENVVAVSSVTGISEERVVYGQTQVKDENGTMGIIMEKVGDNYIIETIAPTGGSAELDGELQVTQNVGGISSGKVYEDGTSLEDIIRDMLNPVVYPTITGPSVSVSGHTPTVLETGTTKLVTFTLTFSKGKIHPLYGTDPLVDADRSGAATGYKMVGDEDYQASNKFQNITVDKDHKTFQFNAEYAASTVQPKDSTLRDYLTPLPAGNVNSSTITYTFTYCMYSNEASIDTIAKIAPTTVKYSDKTRTMNFPACTVANPEIFELPADWTIGTITTYNEYTRTWEDISSEFTTSATTHSDASGAIVNYVRYTFNKGYDMDGRQVKITWT